MQPVLMVVSTRLCPLVASAAQGHGRTPQERLRCTQPLELNTTESTSPQPAHQTSLLVPRWYGSFTTSLKDNWLQ